MKRRGLCSAWAWRALRRRSSWAKVETPSTRPRAHRQNSWSLAERRAHCKGFAAPCARLRLAPAPVPCAPRPAVCLPSTVRARSAKGEQAMSIYTLTDPETRFIAAAMRRCGGRWNGVRNVWMFGSGADAADAALALHRATRATPAMREQLQSMIDDGTAVAAWNYDETQPIDLDALSFTQ